MASGAGGGYCRLRSLILYSVSHVSDQRCPRSVVRTVRDTQWEEGRGERDEGEGEGVGGRTGV